MARGPNCGWLGLAACMAEEEEEQVVMSLASRRLNSLVRMVSFSSGWRHQREAIGNTNPFQIIYLSWGGEKMCFLELLIM